MFKEKRHVSLSKSKLFEPKDLNLKLSKKMKIEFRKQKQELYYLDFNDKEFNEYLYDFSEYLTSGLSISGEDRVDEWNKGWNQNLEKFKHSLDLEDLIPHYFKKYDLFQLNSSIKKALSENIELKILRMIIGEISVKYLNNVDQVYEFGSGTNHNLIEINRWIKHKKYYSLDWAESTGEIANILRSELNYPIEFQKFDFFNPDFNLNILDKSAILTVAALEQVGENYKEFINFIISKKPSLVILIEPFGMDFKNDYFSYLKLLYRVKRNYPITLLQYLDSLEKTQKIKIRCRINTGVGSKYINPYQIVIFEVY
jgi:hypothetical protein